MTYTTPAALTNLSAGLRAILQPYIGRASAAGPIEDGPDEVLGIDEEPISAANDRHRCRMRRADVRRLRRGIPYGPGG